jgi:hypothetical protein
VPAQHLHRRQVGIHTSTWGACHPSTMSIDDTSTTTSGAILCSHPRWGWYPLLLSPSSSCKPVLNPARHGLPQDENRWAF